MRVEKLLLDRYRWRNKSSRLVHTYLIDTLWGNRIVAEITEKQLNHTSSEHTLLYTVQYYGLSSLLGTDTTPAVAQYEDLENAVKLTEFRLRLDTQTLWGRTKRTPPVFGAYDKALTDSEKQAKKEQNKKS